MAVRVNNLRSSSYWVRVWPDDWTSETSSKVFVLFSKWCRANLRINPEIRIHGGYPHPVTNQAQPHYELRVGTEEEAALIMMKF